MTYLSTKEAPEARRRRLTIAALVLLALSGGLWWSTRPKIDPRLVGEWVADEDSPGSFGRRFNADGTSSECQIVSDRRPEWTLDWHSSVTGNVLHDRLRRPWSGGAFGWLRSFYFGICDRLKGREWKYEVIEVSDTRLRIRSIGPSFSTSKSDEIQSFTRHADPARLWPERFMLPPGSIEADPLPMDAPQTAPVPEPAR